MGKPKRPRRDPDEVLLDKDLRHWTPHFEVLQDSPAFTTVRSLGPAFAAHLTPDAHRLLDALVRHAPVLASDPAPPPLAELPGPWRNVSAVPPSEALVSAFEAADMLLPTPVMTEALVRAYARPCNCGTSRARP